MTSGIHTQVNARVLVDAIEEAASRGAAMLFAPEMAGLLDRDRARASASITREEDDGVLAAVREAAVRVGLWVHLGSLAVRREDGRLANRGFVIDDRGEVRARYDKLHLFDVDLPSGESWRESAMKWIWFGWSTAAFLGVLYILWFPLRTISDELGGPIAGAYVKNRAFLTVVWVLYPVVFVVGPEGVRTIDANATAWAILVLDVVAKVVYAFFAAANLDAAWAQTGARTRAAERP